VAKKNKDKQTNGEDRSGVVERYDDASARFDVLMTRLRSLQEIYDDLAERVAKLKVSQSTAVQRPRRRTPRPSKRGSES
jgi:hypothetical protein